MPPRKPLLLFVKGMVFLFSSKYSSLQSFAILYDSFDNTCGFLDLEHNDILTV